MINNNMKIVIYTGPKNEFKKILPKEDITTLHTLANNLDRLNNQQFLILNNSDDANLEDTISNNLQSIKLKDINLLVIYSDSYAHLSKNAYQDFISLINSTNINQLYLQNPPNHIINLLKEVYSKDQIDYDSYEYNLLDKEKFIKINDDFDKNIIGQLEVKKKLLNIFYPSLKKYNNKPISLLFYGSSGIGKTETAKFLSKIFDQELFRKEFSMFNTEKYSDYLFGGDYTDSSFAKDLLERKSNIILLDEFDKANDLFHEAFYQIFDEGIYKDKNYKVELKNTIIICTSNYKNEMNIRKCIGDPLFFRFNKIIKFKELKNKDKKLIIEKYIMDKYEKLDDNDKTVINPEELIEFFNNNVNKFINSRQINNLIDDKLYSILVTNFIKKSKEENIK